MNSKVRKEIDSIITLFAKGDIPKALSYVVLPKQDMPSYKWSFFNRLICYVGGTLDARGMKQWNRVNRKIVKGSKAMYILAPTFRKEEKKDSKEDKILSGFIPVPVFRFEDTEGKPLPEFPPPKPPLLKEVANRWGIEIRYPGSFDENILGYYKDGDRKEIVLATHDEKVFAHELVHAGGVNKEKERRSRNISASIV